MQVIGRSRHERGKTRACSETPSGLESQADLREKRGRRAGHIEICQPRISRFSLKSGAAMPRNSFWFFLVVGFSDML